MHAGKGILARGQGSGFVALAAIMLNSKQALRVSLGLEEVRLQEVRFARPNELVPQECRVVCGGSRPARGKC